MNADSHINKSLLTRQIFLLCLFLVPLQSQAAQDVYEYKNKEGVTEFTDEVKPGKAIERHTQIKKMTPEQKAQSEAKLEEIIEKDKLADEKRALEKKLERERELRLQKERELEKVKNQNSESKNSGSNNDRRPFPPGYRPPVRPVQPIEKPRPRPRSSR